MCGFFFSLQCAHNRRRYRIIRPVTLIFSTIEPKSRSLLLKGNLPSPKDCSYSYNSLVFSKNPYRLFLNQLFWTVLVNFSLVAFDRVSLCVCTCAECCCVCVCHVSRERIKSKEGRQILFVERCHDRLNRDLPFSQKEKENKIKRLLELDKPQQEWLLLLRLTRRWRPHPASCPTCPVYYFITGYCCCCAAAAASLNRH